MRTETIRKLFTVDEYHAMWEAGIFPEDARIELLEGEIYEMSGPGVLHVSWVNRANMVFAGKLTGKAIVSIQNPLRLHCNCRFSRHPFQSRRPDRPGFRSVC